MNVVGIMLDSLRCDHVGCYGNDWISTPVLDELARDSLRFTNAYPEGLPTIPVRTALWTGQCTLAFRPWQPLVKEDVTAAEILRTYGYRTALITDTYHMLKPDMNFHRGFHNHQWIRGQESDGYRSCEPDRDVEDFITEGMRDSRNHRMLIQYLRNTTGRRGPEDYFPHQVFSAAARWVREAATRGDFFLWVDSFDPHEPWDPPAPYDTMYTDPNYTGKKIIHPKYGPVGWMTEEELQNTRALYAGEVTFVDHCVGFLIDALKETGVYDDTLIVALSDHGHPHGDHGDIMKHDRDLYNELLRIPLLIKRPDGKYADGTCDALVQQQDLLPTILDTLGIGPVVPMHGKSLWPLVGGKVDKLHDYVVMGYHPSEHRCIRDQEWSFILRPEGQQDELYNLIEDPKEQNNLIAERTDIAQRMFEALGRWSRARRVGKQKLTIQLQYEIEHTPAED